LIESLIEKPDTFFGMGGRSIQVKVRHGAQHLETLRTRTALQRALKLIDHFPNGGHDSRIGWIL
jgi:hypothetical protein